jgi:hypothetical protein
MSAVGFIGLSDGLTSFDDLFGIPMVSYLEKFTQLVMYFTASNLRKSAAWTPFVFKGADDCYMSVNNYITLSLSYSHHISLYRPLDN